MNTPTLTLVLAPTLALALTLTLTLTLALALTLTLTTPRRGSGAPRCCRRSARSSPRSRRTLPQSGKAAWSKCPPGSARARLPRLLRARLIALAGPALPRDRPTRRQATASGARASRLQSRRVPAFDPSGRAGRRVGRRRVRRCRLPCGRALCGRAWRRPSPRRRLGSRRLRRASRSTQSTTRSGTRCSRRPGHPLTSSAICDCLSVGLVLVVVVPRHVRCTSLLAHALAPALPGPVLFLSPLGRRSFQSFLRNATVPESVSAHNSQDAKPTV